MSLLRAILSAARAGKWLSTCGAILLGCNVGAATLVWNPNAETPAGYNVYYSALPEVSLQKTNVGLATSLNVSFAQPGRTYTFYVTAYNAEGLESEPSETLAYIPQAGVTPPAVVTSPVSLSVSAGSPATFQVTATGSAPLAYQWYLNNAPIPGATSSAYSINSAQPAHAGSYLVRVSNSAGSVPSQAATLTVTSPPQITAQPASQTLNQGESLIVTVTASGSALTYQWFKNGNPVLGANSSSFYIAFLQPTDAASYTVKISNSDGTVTSAPAIVTVITPPTITQHPASRSVNAGSELTLTVVAVSTGAMSYQWQKDGANISGATNATLRIPNVSGGTAGSYRVRVENSAGVVNSAVAVVSIVFPPSIVAHPVGVNANSGATVSLTVTASGSAPLSYQWLRFGINVPGATASTLVMTNATEARSGVYSVRVSNSAGSVLSSNATVTIIAPPVITQQPLSRSVNAGATLSLSVQVTGTLPISYQWFKNGTAISGAVGPQYQLASVDSSAAGNYTVRASNPAGTVTSATASVTVISAPVITLQPVSKTVAYGSTLSLTVQASGSGPLTVRWLKDGVLIAGATSFTYSVGSAGTEHSGRYVAEVSNSAGTVLSVPAIVTVTLPGAPTVTQQPANANVPVGGGFTLTVGATGTGPFSYQWYKNGSPIQNAVSSQYTVTSASSADAGEYRVRVSNVGGETLSASAHVAVGVPPAIMRQPADQVVEVGNTAIFSVDAAGTAPFSYRWFRSGVEIPGATNSVLTIQYALISEAGEYQVEIRNSAGSVFSQPATLSITGLPAIVTAPASTTVAYGASVSFLVQATGTAPLVFRWIKDGAYVPGATNSTLVIVSAESSHSGSYSVEISNAGGIITSPTATLTVQDALRPLITQQPVSRDLEIGGFVTLVVQASGTPPFTYQWLKNGAVLPGATQASLAIGDAGVEDAGAYRVHVNNIVGSTLSEAAIINVGTAPIVTADPLSQTVATGSAVSFSVQAEGSAPLSYRWAKDGLYLPGKTSSTLSFASVTAVNAGSYSVEVSNPVGSVLSSAANLVVTTSSSTNTNAVLPTITLQPQSKSADPGSTVTFTAEATGSSPLKYHWIFEGSYIPGATNAVLTLPSVTLENAGAYTLEVSNLGGAVLSKPATLHLIGSPVIITSPQSQTIPAGTSLALSVQVSGMAPLTYRWVKSGNVIPGATAPTLFFQNAQPSDSGTYAVEVSNGAGRAASVPATITVQSGSSGGGSQFTPPTITRHPSTVVAQVGLSAVFSVEATANSAITYRWIRNGSYIPGATTPTLTVSPVSLSDAGSYSVQVETIGGAVISTPAALIVTGAPTLISQPKSQNLNIGNPLLLTVEVEGVQPFSFRWIKNGTYVPGATNVALEIRAVTMADSGSYSVEVSNAAGTVTSQAAVVIVNAAGSYIVWHPETQAVNAGEAVILYVETSSVFDLNYRWIHNGSYVPGANMSFLHIPVVTTGDEGAYRVEVSSVGGTEISQTAVLTVTGAPEITRQPQNTSVQVGGSFTLSVEATGGEPMTYVWSKNGSLVSGGTSRILQVNSAKLTDAGNYVVEITNGAGFTRSVPATVTVNGAPVIVNHPQSTNVVVGGVLQLAVTADGANPMTYQWIKNGSIVGTTSTNVLTLSNVKVSDAGDYSVSVQNGAGQATSAPARIVVDGAPNIVTHPASQTAVIGRPLTLSVSVQGAAPFTYRWIKNGSYISAANASSYQIPSVTQSDQGNYSVEILNVAGRVVSQVAVVTVTNQTADFRLDLSPKSSGDGFSLSLPPGTATYEIQYKTNLTQAWKALLRTNVTSATSIDLPDSIGNSGFFRIVTVP